MDDFTLRPRTRVDAGAPIRTCPYTRKLRIAASPQCAKKLGEEAVELALPR